MAILNFMSTGLYIYIYIYIPYVSKMQNFGWQSEITRHFGE